MREAAQHLLLHRTGRQPHGHGGCGRALHPHRRWLRGRGTHREGRGAAGGRPGLTDADAPQTARADDVKAKAEAAVDKPFNLEGIRDNLHDNIAQPGWHDLCMRCISCGTCTYVCPSCYCFSINDEIVESSGERYRVWDNCFNPMYTEETSGHNPRAQKSNRFRNRFSHKFWYYPDKYDSLLCSGCGRCIAELPHAHRYPRGADGDGRASRRGPGHAGAPAAAPRPTGRGLDGHRRQDPPHRGRRRDRGHHRPRRQAGGQPYLPEVATVVDIIQETPTIKTFRMQFDDPEVQKSFSFLPGQVGQLGIFGVGEATFAITSKPSERDFIQFSVMKAGEVTKALHNLSEGDKVGIRAPMGCGFPVEDWKGKRILFVMGGIGSAALKATIEYTLEHRADYAGVSILYGATAPENFTYQYDIDDWQKRKDLDLTLTIDKDCEGWQCDVGLVPAVLEKMNPDPKDTIAILCGPPIMIKFTLMSFEKLGFTPEQTYTTLEKRMKCGIGICGRCNVGPKYVCVDGPVFSMAELNGLPDEL